MAPLLTACFGPWTYRQAVVQWVGPEFQQIEQAETCQVMLIISTTFAHLHTAITDMIPIRRRGRPSPEAHAPPA